MPDDELLEEVAARAQTQHRAVAALVAGLVGSMRGSSTSLRDTHRCSHAGTCFDCPSAAYNRIEAARAARKFPLILRLLADGSATLTTITLLGPHLTDENHEEVLRIATHRSKREVELLLAALRPLPAVPSTIRKLPSATRPAGVATITPTERLSGPDTVQPAITLEREEDKVIIVPLSPDRYRVQFAMTREMHDRLRRVQDLLRHSVRDGNAAGSSTGLSLLLLTSSGAKWPGRTGRAEFRTSRLVAATCRRPSAADLGAGWRTMRVCRRGRSLPGAGISGDSSLHRVCRRWRDDGG